MTQKEVLLQQQWFFNRYCDIGIKRLVFMLFGEGYELEIQNARFL